MSKTNITIVAALLAIIGMVSGLAAAATTASTSVSGPLSASFEISTPPSGSISFSSAAVVGTEQRTTADSLTVKTNHGWQLSVYGAKLAGQGLSPAHSADNALQVYAGELNPSINKGALGADNTHITTIDSGTGGTGGQGQTVYVQYGQTFTYNDPDASYSTTVNYSLISA